MKGLDASQPELSVIIPTLNRGKVLYSTITQVLSQQGCEFELIIVDQSDEVIAQSNKAFVDAVGDTRVKYFRIEEKNLPNARNIGIVKSLAKIILFLDDDVIILRDEFLTAHLGAFDDPAVGGVTGRSVERLIKSNTKRTACHVSIGGRTKFNLMGLSRQPIGTCKGSNMSFGPSFSKRSVALIASLNSWKMLTSQCG